MFASTSKSLPRAPPRSLRVTASSSSSSSGQSNSNLPPPSLRSYPTANHAASFVSNRKWDEEDERASRSSSSSSSSSPSSSSIPPPPPPPHSSRSTSLTPRTVRSTTAPLLTSSSPSTSSPPSHPDHDILIEFQNVTKSFGSKRILRGASFSIRRGEAVGIIGGSGTGKSTTLKLIAGLLAPDAGQVVIKGRPRRGLNTDDDMSNILNIGLVFQSAALFDSLTVGQNVGFLLYEHTNLPLDEIALRVEETLGKVGLPNVQHLYPNELSGGMKKRVALARAIINDGVHDGVDRVVMYDEPTAGLDPVASTVVEDLIRDMRERGGITSYIVVTHQHSTIRRSVDKVIFLHKGRVVWAGSVEEFDSTEEEIVVQFRTGSLKGPIKYT